MKNLLGDLKRYHPLQKIVLLAVLGLAVHLILPEITTLEHSWQELKSLLPWAVGFAFAAQVLSYLGSGYLLEIILGLGKIVIKLWRSTLIVLGAASIGMVAGGMVGSSLAIFHWTSTNKGKSETATLASILPSLLNSIVIVFVSIFGLIHLILTHDLSKSQLVSFSVILLLLSVMIGMLYYGIQHKQQTTSVITWVGQQLARIRRKPFNPEDSQTFAQNLFSAWDSLRKGAWQGMVIGAVLNVVFDMLTLFFLFIAAGHSISLGVLLSGYGLPLLLGKMAFIIPGGVGVVESSMAALYSGLGVPYAKTVVVVLGYRFISFWIPSLSGFPIAAYLQRSMRAK